MLFQPHCCEASNVIYPIISTQHGLLGKLGDTSPWFTCHIYSRPWLGYTKPVYSVLLFSQFFSIIKTHVTYSMSCSYLTGVRSAVMAPIKCECDSKNLTSTFVKWKNSLMEKNNKWFLSNLDIKSWQFIMPNYSVQLWPTWDWKFVLASKKQYLALTGECEVPFENTLETIDYVTMAHYCTSPDFIFPLKTPAQPLTMGFRDSHSTTLLCGANWGFQDIYMQTNVIYESTQCYIIVTVCML